MSGVGLRGQRVFDQKCASCHVVDGRGFAVGPELRALPDKSPARLLESILDPGRQLDPRYTAYLAVTGDGRLFSGLLAGETDHSVTLRMAESREHTLLRSDLESLRDTGKSLMPEGFENDLSRQDLADLIRFLAELEPAPKSLQGNRPELVQADADGTVTLSAERAAIVGQEITFELPLRNIGYWHGQQDHVRWEWESPQLRRWSVFLELACHDDSAGNQFLLEAAGQSLSGQVPATGGWDRYQRIGAGTLELPAGRQRLTVRPAGQLRAALMDLRAVLLVPEGQALAVAQAPAAADPAQLARQLVDDQLPAAEREAIVAAHPRLAVELVRALAAGLDGNVQEEYRRIPWMWRVSIAAGRRNDTAQLRELLRAALPQPGAPLTHWQAVVLGGGVVNGVSDRGAWPRPRVAELIGDDAALGARWERLLDQAAAMADDQQVPTPTRYDALRILGADTWRRRGAQLARYLAAEVHEELQMGGVSAAADVQDPAATAALLAGLAHFAKGNQGLALDSLFRDESRTDALLDALEAGRVTREILGAPRVERLRSLPDARRRARAEALLKRR
jgi:putative heme-binding domain-containing protein